MKKFSTLLLSLAFASCMHNDVSDVTLASPAPGSKVISPVTIAGSAPGPWFFEGNIVAELQSADGTVLAVSGMQAQGEWMTEGPVAFSGELTFQTDAQNGFLIIRNDNPSGLPENDKSQRFDVQF
jgi:hypothetical protein